MKQLKEQFTGIGQVKGFNFTQLERSPFAYLYEVNTGDNVFHEVFYHKENKRYNCVSYPTDKAFGVWAWTYKSLEKAKSKFDYIEKKCIDNIKNEFDKIID